jgi:hypothetical protein
MNKKLVASCSLPLAAQLAIHPPPFPSHIRSAVQQMAAPMLHSPEHRLKMWSLWASLWMLNPWPPELSARDGTTGANSEDPECTYRTLFWGHRPEFMQWLLCSATYSELQPHHLAFLQYVHDALVIHDRVQYDYDQIHPGEAIADVDHQNDDIDAVPAEAEGVFHTVGG